MIKLSNDQNSHIVEEAFIDELKKIAMKIPFSGGVNIPHSNIKNFLKDITSSERYNPLDTMKYAPGIKHLRSELAKNIVAKRAGKTPGTLNSIKATAAKEIRKLTLADAPAVAISAIAPIPLSEFGYIAARKGAGTAMDIAKKKGLYKPTPDLRPIATRLEPPKIGLAQ